jgi:hypothetical protein
MLAMAAVTVAAIVGVTGSAMAATPTKGARYSARVHPPHSNYPQIDLNVRSGGRTMSVTGPGEECHSFTAGDQAMIGKINNARIDAQGRFKGSAKYIAGWGGYVAPHGVPIANYTYHWSLSISGRFVDKRTAKGTLTYGVLLGGGRSELHAPAGTVGSCGKVSVKFTAKRGALYPIHIDVPSPEDF